MPGIYNQLEIANRALGICSEPRLLSLDPTSSARADLIVRTLPHARLLALSRNPWKFATKFYALNRSAAFVPSDTKYAYCYSLPAGAVRCWSTKQEITYPWNMEEGYLITNDPEPSAYVTVDFGDDYSGMPVWFAEVLVNELALMVVSELSGVEMSRRKLILAEYLGEGGGRQGLPSKLSMAISQDRTNTSLRTNSIPKSDPARDFTDGIIEGFPIRGY